MPTKRRWNCYVCAALLCGAALLVSCDESPTGPADAGGMRVRGVTLADWTSNGYASASAEDALDDIAALGANTVTLIRTAYQDGVTSSLLEVDGRTPSESSLRAAASHARSLGLRVVLKPHVDVETGAWRGEISPSDVDAWFASYGEFVLETAALAAALDAERYVVGTELAGTIGHEERWRSLIARVRQVYGGEVVYAASWDGANRLGFWDALDLVGVDFYGSVTRRADPGRVEILAGWQPWLERLHLLHQLTDKRILLTEIGYRSVDGAGREPFAFGDHGTVDTDEQADLYWGALEAVGGKGWIEGMYWWNWLANGEGGSTNTDYTPKGKPAQGELKGAWR